MKLKNLFKKGNTTHSKVKFEALDKSQLEKIIGGAETSGSVPFVGGAISGAANSGTTKNGTGAEVWNQPTG